MISIASSRAMSSRRARKSRGDRRASAASSDAKSAMYRAASSGSGSGVRVGGGLLGGMPPAVGSEREESWAMDAECLVKIRDIDTTNNNQGRVYVLAVAKWV